MRQAQQEAEAKHGDVSVEPQTIDLGLTALQTTSEKDVAVHNTSPSAKRMRVRVDLPFAAYPSSFKLDSNASQNVTISFTPSEASPFHGAAAIESEVGGAVGVSTLCGTIALYGSGKKPFIQFDVKTLQFQPLYVGQKEQTRVQLVNPSHVSASFTLNWADSHHSSLSVSPLRGTLRPQSKMPLRILHAPQCAGLSHVSRLRASVSGGSGSTLHVKSSSCTGYLQLKPSSLAFGHVRVGWNSSVRVALKNPCAVPITFTAANASASDGVFCVTPNHGCVDAQSSNILEVHFKPTSAMQLHRRIVLLARHSDPLALDVVGTGTTHHKTPDQLRMEQIARANAPQNTPKELLWQLARAPHADPEACISVQPSVVDFGAQQLQRLSQTQVVEVSNSSKHTLDVLLAPSSSVQQQQASSKETAFQVFPECKTVPAFGSASFKVAFKPAEASKHFAALFEVFAQRAMASTCDGVQEAPMCASFHVLGHSFTDALEASAPPFTFHPTDIELIPCCPGETSWTAALLRNNGDTAVHYDLIQTGAHPFTLSPSCGVVPPNSDMLTVAAFDAPRQNAGDFQRLLEVVLNRNAMLTERLQLHSSSTYPRLAFDGRSTVYFRPTCVGTESTRTVMARNASAVRACFALQLPDRLDGVVSVEPQTGVIDAHGFQTLTFYFSPLNKRAYQATVPVLVSTGASESSPADLLADRTRQTGHLRCVEQFLTVHGEGTEGALSTDVDSVNIGAVCVEATSSAAVTVYNSSSGSVSYTMRVVPTSGGVVVEADKPSETIDNRSYAVVTLRCTPRTRAEFHAKVVFTTNASASDQSLVQHSTEVQLHGTGELPQLQVLDADSMDASKADIWRRFGLGSINAELKCNLNDAERALNGAKIEAATEDAVHNLYSYPVYLGNRLQSSRDVRYRLLLRNTGNLQVKWSLTLCHEDEDFELETWIDTGKPKTDEGLHMAHVAEQKLIDVRPRSGKIQPGESNVLTVTARHDEVGSHCITALLCITRGKRLRLDLAARTATGETAFFDQPESDVQLASGLLGDTQPQVQYVPLRNPNHEHQQFTISTSMLDELQQRSYGYKPLRLAKESGSIPPNSAAQLPFIFQPIESGLHSVNLPVRFTSDNGESFMLHVLANGYDPRDISSDNSTFECSGFSESVELTSAGPAKLSRAAVLIGRVPCKAVERHLVVLSSCCQNEHCRFAFEKVDSQCFESEVSVTPESGRLAPCERKACVIEFSAGVRPESLESELVCHVATESAYQRKREETVSLAEADSIQTDGYVEQRSELIEGEGTRFGTSRDPDLNLKHVSVAERSTVTYSTRLAHSTANYNSCLSRSIGTAWKSASASGEQLKRLHEPADELEEFRSTSRALRMSIHVTVVTDETYRRNEGNVASHQKFVRVGPTKASKSSDHGNAPSADGNDLDEGKKLLLLGDILAEVVRGETMENTLAALKEEPTYPFLDWRHGGGDWESRYPICTEDTHEGASSRESEDGQPTESDRPGPSFLYEEDNGKDDERTRSADTRGEHVSQQLQWPLSDNAVASTVEDVLSETLQKLMQQWLRKGRL